MGMAIQHFRRALRPTNHPSRVLENLNPGRRASICLIGLNPFFVKPG